MRKFHVPFLVVSYIVLASLSVRAEVDIRGVTINLLVEKDNIIHNALRWMDTFYLETGANVTLYGVGYSQVATEMITATHDQLNFYDAFIFTAQQIVDYADCSSCRNPTLLADLTEYVRNTPSLDWPDIAYYFRSYGSQYNGKVYAIPFDGDVHFMYYRKDLLDKYGLAVPRTWPEYKAVAIALNAGEASNPDFSASCLPKAANNVWSWFTFTFAAPYLQYLGTSQGIFFDTETFEPLASSLGFRQALLDMKESNRYGHVDERTMDLSTSRNLMMSGKCGLTIDWGDTVLLANASSVVHGKVGIAQTPGATSVYNRATKTMMACTPELCPYAVDGINRAPFAASGGWVGGVNSYSSEKRAAAATAFISLMGSKTQSNVDVTKGSGFEMYRRNQMSANFWVGNGFSPAEADNIVTNVLGALENHNVVSDLRIEKNSDYLFTIATPEVLAFLNDKQDIDTTMSNIAAGWNALSKKIGTRKQLQKYRLSLGLTPLSFYDCSSLKDCSHGGECVADGVCLCDNEHFGAACDNIVISRVLGATSIYGVLIILLSSIGILAALGMLTALIIKKDTIAGKQTSAPMVSLITIGIIFGFVSSFMSLGTPTALSCISEQILVGLGFMFVLTNLVSKTYRIHRIFNNSRLMVVKLPNKRTMQIAFSLSLPFLVLLITLVAGYPSVPVETRIGNDKFITCSIDESEQTVIRVLMLIYLLFLLGSGCYLAFQTRSIQGGFSETGPIGNSMYAILIGLVVVIPISYTPMNAVLRTTIRLVLQNMVLFTLMALVVGKNVYAVFHEKLTHSVPDQSGRALSNISSMISGIKYAANSTKTDMTAAVYPVAVLKKGFTQTWQSGYMVVTEKPRMISFACPGGAFLPATPPSQITAVTSGEADDNPAHQIAIFTFTNGASYRVDSTNEGFVELCVNMFASSGTKGTAVAKNSVDAHKAALPK